MTPTTRATLRARAQALRDYGRREIDEATADALDHLASCGDVCAADLPWPERTARRAVARVREVEGLTVVASLRRANAWGLA